jgi:hypothetical protein
MSSRSSRTNSPRQKVADNAAHRSCHMVWQRGRFDFSVMWPTVVRPISCHSKLHGSCARDHRLRRRLGMAQDPMRLICTFERRYFFRSQLHVD